KAARTRDDQKVLTNANVYTNKRVGDLMDEASGRILRSSQNYTDQRISEAKKYTDNKFGQLNNKIKKVEKRLNAGIAGVTAISSIPYISGHRFSYGIGIGNYQNGKAIAAGIQYRMTENINIRLNASSDSSSNTALGVGLAGGW
ncbi:YadA-like family protein, partial [Salmonella enterica]|nr:YadA-like family protein [Salmonella enterica]